MSSRPSRLRYHLMFTVWPCSGPDRKRPSMPAAAADGSSSISKISYATHSPRCPDVIGRRMSGDLRIEWVPLVQQLRYTPYRLVVHNTKTSTSTSPLTMLCRIWRSPGRPGSGRHSRDIRSCQQRAPRPGDDLHARYTAAGRRSASDHAGKYSRCDGEGRETLAGPCAPGHCHRSPAVAAPDLALCRTITAYASVLWEERTEQE